MNKKAFLNGFTNMFGIKKNNSLSSDILDKYDITKYNDNKAYKRDFDNIAKSFENVGKDIRKAMKEFEKSEEYIKAKAKYKK